MSAHTQITVSQLSHLIGTPQMPVIVDVCIDDDFHADPRLIPSSFRLPYKDIASLAPRAAGKRVVVICQKGLKLSMGAAAVLRHHGIKAESLEGGIFAWHDAGEPLIPAAKVPPPNEQGHTLWVTRQRPKISRIACPWLIRRFMDPGAQFLFVAAEEVINVAERFEATPFDIEDVHWSPRSGKTTFDVMIDELELHIPALKHLGEIVRGAAFNQHDIAPQAAGLSAASLGLSQMYRDDLEQLAAGMSLYDAFYHWARDATGERYEPSIAPAQDKAE